jgi:hypothetical protein
MAEKIDKENVRKIVTEDLDNRKVCAKQRRKAKILQFAKTLWRGKMIFWAMSL